MFTQICGSPDQTAHAFFNAPAIPVIEQPVMLLHMREEEGKRFRKPADPLPERIIYGLGKIIQTIFREFIFVGGQEMVVYHIHKSAGIQAVVGTEDLFRFRRGFMAVGELVDHPVQVDTVLNSGWIFEFLLAFDEITDHVAGEDVGMAE